MSEPSDKIPILFIVNPFSGVGQKKQIAYHLEKKLDLTKFTYKVSYTDHPRHATELSEKAVKDGYRVIVAVGGDGTVNETARPLIGTEIALGIIPSGSGNGLARHLQIPFDIDKAIRTINLSQTRKIDIVEINDQIFLSIAGVGFDAHVAKKFARQSQRGFWGYARVALREYFRYRPKKFVLIVDGKKIKRRALFISFANSDQFGYNTSIAPNACIDDGMVDVCIARKTSLFKTLLWAPLLLFRKIDKAPYIEIIRAREVDIKQSKKKINLDGEPLKLGKRLHIHVVPASLNVIVP
ncbi:MAG TPA: diacylglycerol kinase family lipid kinase [Bacteroidales bacterium]|nr:diacylglycerol kinase family lipid kinase [Bacteroidales bacterium]HPR58007.1 diacylglycerol kinase family lipid kinase [Bacteroidales bacterium]HRW96646.1 diacylglycerol kinase family lipid kinase [Bacteroidales bacterium]